MFLNVFVFELYGRIWPLAGSYSLFDGMIFVSWLVPRLLLTTNSKAVVSWP